MISPYDRFHRRPERETRTSDVVVLVLLLIAVVLMAVGGIGILLSDYV